MGQITPVILAGGSGSRLWPLSTPEKPKQFHCLFSELSLFQDACLRVSDRHLFSDPMIIANASHRHLIKEQLSHIGIKPQAILLESEARNTAFSVALACHYAANAMPSGASTPLLIMPSDHVIRDDRAFHKAVALAGNLSGQHIVTFGITPDHPSEQYGYLCQGAPIALSGGFHVQAFHEKPCKEQSQQWIDAGGYFFNSGMFCFQPHLMVAELQRYATDVQRQAAQALWQSSKEANTFMLTNKAGESVPNLSIDKAVMEHTAKAAMIPLDAGWSDVGNWPQLMQQLPQAIHHRPWGYFQVLHELANAKIKLLSIEPGARTSLQRHCHRSEHWIVLQGQALVTKEDQSIMLKAHESTFIHAGELHRIANPCRDPLLLFEIQTGTTICENDIERLEDDYGRCVHPLLQRA